MEDKFLDAYAFLNALKPEVIKTRWTFFRVKLVFECEFEISWSFGSWDLGTPGPWNPWTLGFLYLFPHPFLSSSNTSSYFPLHPLTSSYLFLLLSSFGMLWLWRWTFDLYIDLKKLWVGWVEPWDLLLPSTFSSSNLLPPPSYSSQLPHTPPNPPPNSSYLLPKGLR